MSGWTTILNRTVSKSKLLYLVARYDLPTQFRYRIELECTMQGGKMYLFPITNVFIEGLGLEAPKQGLFIDEGDRSITIFPKHNGKCILYYHNEEYYLLNVKQEEIEEFQKLMQVKNLLEDGIVQEDLENAVKLYMSQMLQSQHETGNCNCLDVTRGCRCVLSFNRSIDKRSQDLKDTYGCDEMTRNFCNFIHQKLHTDILINNYVYSNIKSRVFEFVEMLGREIYN